MNVKRLIFLCGFVVISAGSFAFGEDPFPQCSRPPNMGEPTFLKKYETCLNIQTKFCKAHSKIPSCLALAKDKHPHHRNEQSISENCKIQWDGAYRCQPSTIRFIVKEDTPIPNVPKIDGGDEYNQPNTVSAPGAKPIAPAPGPAATPISPSFDPGGSLAIPPPLGARVVPPAEFNKTNGN